MAERRWRDDRAGADAVRRIAGGHRGRRDFKLRQLTNGLSRLAAPHGALTSPTKRKPFRAMVRMTV